ncbi:MAG: hypothetical protein SFU27_13335 [Thermonemataceae bacterium]|nr:hypothetical protein [Thermonemataceae bacterium]
MLKTLQYINSDWGYFELEAHSDLEVRIMEDAAWQEGLFFGKPRHGHPEGKIINHIREVLANVESLRWRIDEESYHKLRLVTLIHDTFKHKVDEKKPRTKENHHAYIARKFAEKYITDASILEVIELHDEAYHSWRELYCNQNPEKSALRWQEFIRRMSPFLDFFYLFFVCDTQTGDKDQSPLRWFEQKTGLQRVDTQNFI